MAAAKVKRKFDIKLVGSGFVVPVGDAPDGVELAAAIFWHFPHYGNQGGTPGSSVRAGDWKLIEFFEGGRLELYDLRSDIGETRNLAESRPEVRDRLHRLLKTWRERISALEPTPNPDWPW